MRFLPREQDVKRMSDVPRDELLQQTKADVAARLRRVCPGMPEAEFDRLVEVVARVNLKYLMRRTNNLFNLPADGMSGQNER